MVSVLVLVFGKFVLGKKVLIFVSENLVSEEKYRYRFGKFGLGKKISVSVSENLVSEINLGITFGQNFGIVIQCCPGQLKRCIDLG